MTINKVCGSGLKAVMLAAQAIALRRRRDRHRRRPGEHERLAARAARTRATASAWATAKLVDTMIVDGLWDVYNQYHMGIDRRERRQEVRASRAREQDAFALASRSRRRRPRRKPGRFKDEIVPVDDPAEEGRPDRLRQPTSSSTRRPTPKRSPACAPRSTRPARVTAGNASGLNDGAAAVVVMTARSAPRSSA